LTHYPAVACLELTRGRCYGSSGVRPRTTVEAYIHEQPTVLRHVFAEVPAVVAAVQAELPAHPGAIVLIGSGTSGHALVAVRALLARRLACPVFVCGPLAFLTEAPLSATTEALAIVLSQSGASRTTVEAVEVARARGMATLVITAEADSAIAALAGPRLIMPVGSETVGPKTKGYTASVATLLCLALGAGWPRARDDAAAVVDALEADLLTWRRWSRRLADKYARAGHAMVLAQGRHLATAHEASLKIAEMSGLAVSAFDVEEGLHGRFHALDATSPAFFIAGTPDEAMLARRTMITLAALGIPCELVTLGGDSASGTLGVRLPPLSALRELDLLAAVVPFQLLAHDLALARGMVPQAMPYPGLSAKLGIKISDEDV
jgi:fructoselysine-6-P-deglycase FrlB-like protein